MTKLWIGNMAPGTTDETLREFVAKYAGNLECTAIQRVDGDGTRPAAILTFAGGDLESVPKLALRLNGMYWQGRKLMVSAT
ncbi:MAG: RNA-binding protein [Betaproteobacteria bacterium]|nr:RNA-binding protein [Betaproteobacteria bacterium]MCC7217738.1 RNA-binding protein [Burkholderiales bacterium]